MRQPPRRLCAHPVGTLDGAAPMLIKDVFEQIPPHTRAATARVAAGEKHVLLAFTLPNSPDPKALYATPVGNFEAGNYTFLSATTSSSTTTHTRSTNIGGQKCGRTSTNTKPPPA